MTNQRQKALLITTQIVAEKTIASVLDRHSIEIDTSYDALSSVPVIKGAYGKTGNTVFIRKAFSRLVSEHGTPHLLIIDYRIFLSSNLKDDPDMRKILCTFLISYMILNRDHTIPQFANIVLIDVGKKGSGAGEIEKNPLVLLDILDTSNSEINALVQSYRKDLGRFLKLFRFIALSPRDDRTLTSSKLEKFIMHIQGSYARVPGARETGIDPSQVNKPGDKTGSDIPECHVVVKTGVNSMFIDGKECAPPTDGMYSDLQDSGIYIIGHWSRKNQREITDSIFRTVAQGTGLKIFRKTEEIVLNLSRECVIDSTIISSLFTMVNQDLADYPKLKILVDFKNGVTLENSPGYITIKNRVYHVY